MPVYNADVANIFNQVADEVDLERVMEAALDRGCFLELNT